MFGVHVICRWQETGTVFGVLKRGKLQLEQGLIYLFIIALPESVFIIITTKDESLVALMLEGSLWQVVSDFSWCLDSS